MAPTPDPTPPPREAPPPAPQEPPAFAPDADAVAKARRYLEQKDLPKNVVTEFLHFGADFNEWTFKGVGPLTGPDGQPAPGFAVYYKYRWASDGVTNVAYICNSAGVVSRLQVMDSNAETSKPFSVAKIMGALLGAFIEQAIKDDQKMTAEDKAQMQTLVRNAEVEKLLNLYLVLGQIGT